MNELLLQLLTEYRQAMLSKITFPWGADNSVFPIWADLPFNAEAISLFDFEAFGAAEEWDRESGDFPIVTVDEIEKKIPITATAAAGSVGTHTLENLQEAMRLATANSRFLESLVSVVNLQQEACMKKVIEKSHLFGLYGNKRNVYGFLNMPAGDVNTVVSAVNPYTATYDEVEAWLNRELVGLSARMGLAMSAFRILTNPTLYTRLESLKQPDTGESILTFLDRKGVSVAARSELYSQYLEAQGIGIGENLDRLYLYPSNNSDLCGKRVSTIFQSGVKPLDPFNLRRGWYLAQAHTSAWVNNKSMTIVKFAKTADVYPN